MYAKYTASTCEVIHRTSHSAKKNLMSVLNCSSFGRVHAAIVYVSVSSCHMWQSPTCTISYSPNYKISYVCQWPLPSQSQEGILILIVLYIHTNIPIPHCTIVGGMIMNKYNSERRTRVVEWWYTTEDTGQGRKIKSVISSRRFSFVVVLSLS